MIFTQTIFDLCKTDWKPMGAFILRQSDDIDVNGYGQGRLTALKKISDFIEEKYGSKVHLVNAKMTVEPGPGHPAYNRIYLTITGDLYKCSN